MHPNHPVHPNGWTAVEMILLLELISRYGVDFKHLINYFKHIKDYDELKKKILYIKSRPQCTGVLRDYYPNALEAI